MSHSSAALLCTMASSEVIWIYSSHMGSVSSKERILWRVALLYLRCIMEQVYADRTWASAAPAQTQITSAAACGMIKIRINE